MFFEKGPLFQSRDWKCRPNQTIPKLYKRLWGQKVIVPFNLESFYQSLPSTNFIHWMREVWKKVIVCGGCVHAHEFCVICRLFDLECFFCVISCMPSNWMKKLVAWLQRTSKTTKKPLRPPTPTDLQSPWFLRWDAIAKMHQASLQGIHGAEIASMRQYALKFLSGLRVIH